MYNNRERGKKIGHQSQIKALFSTRITVTWRKRRPIIEFLVAKIGCTCHPKWQVMYLEKKIKSKDKKQPSLYPTKKKKKTNSIITKILSCPRHEKLISKDKIKTPLLPSQSILYIWLNWLL